MSTETPREHLAWLMYCYQQGYTDPRDRAILTSWIGNDAATLHPDDVKLRGELLGMADEILALIAAGENRRLFSTVYRSMINGDVWCEGTDPDEVRESPRTATLVKQETWLVSDKWTPWDGKTP